MKKIGNQNYGFRGKYMELLENGLFIGFFIGICLTGVFISVLCSVLAWTKVQSLEKSTHTFQYVPIDEEIDKQNEEYMKGETWATSSQSIQEQEKLRKKERDELMPEFTPSDAENKTYTF